LIFVLGNLDECYKMAGDLNSDLDADYFYNKTKNINIIDIRRALLKRFRSEQIARLGSTHIIYPSLNKKAFKDIINKELSLFGDMVKTKFSPEEGVYVNKVEFSENIENIIYKEGVFPVVGARSVFSIINVIISDKFPTIISNILRLKTNNENVNGINIKFDYNKSKSIIELSMTDSSNNNIISTDLFKYNAKVDNLRMEKDKGKQTHRAVHEAGHAVCSIILEKSFPEVVYSVVINDKSGGFNLLNSEDLYYHRKNTYENRLATMLAGYAAEKIIFGDENISNGSGSDIDNATTMLASLFKDSGFLINKMGKFVSKVFTSTMFDSSNYTIEDVNGDINKELIQHMNRGLSKAINTLNSQKVLFLKVSEYLSKNPKMTNKKLKEFTKKYIVDLKYDDILKDKNKFYVEMLDNELNNLQNGE